VPFVHLGRQHAELAEELRAVVDSVLADSDAGHAAEVEAFEREFAGFCGARYAVGVATGTAALSLGLIAAGIGPGDEVILPAYAPITAALGVLHAGATPVLCDVRADTGLIDTASAAELVGKRTAAIVAVHMFGQVCDMHRIGEFAERHGLLVVEDAAEAHGASFAGARAGSFADVAAFSFHPRRNLGTLGNGGAVCTGDPAVAERVRRLRDLGQRDFGEHVEIGFEADLDGLQAAVLRVKLRHLEQKNAARRAWANMYRAVLPADVTTLWEDPRGECVYHLFPVRLGNRDAVLAGMRRAGVAAGVHCDPPLHVQPPLIAHRIAHVGVGASEEWSNEEISLPMFAELTVEEVQRVAEALRSTLDETAS
jgi:dTDP-4-amino-4,6-dideoxygalactose transaminase